MFQFLGSRRETAYIMSLTGIILGIFLMVGALSLLFDIEKRQQRRASQRMQQTMLVNNELSTFERPEPSSGDEVEDASVAQGIHKRGQTIPTTATSPPGRLATYSQTNADASVSIDIHPKSPSRQHISDQYRSSGSRGPLRSLGTFGPLGAYSISGDMPPFRYYPGSVPSRDNVQGSQNQNSTLGEDRIISCQTFPSSCSEDSVSGHPNSQGSHPDAPPAYESETTFSTRTGTSGAQGYLPQYQQPPPYTPYSDDPPPPYSP